LIQPTILPNGKRIPGLKLDHPRQLALMHALVRFSHIAAQDSFSTLEIHADTAEALGRTTTEYTLGSLRYDLSKLRAKGLVQRLHKSRRYRLTADGYRICVVYLKLFEKLYAPLTSAILKPFKQDRRLLDSKTSQFDKLYRAVVASLDQLVNAVGLKVA
jgi:predicted MarR family transcription regulator